MASNKNESEEELPGDFFDDFSKEEFIEGLNVIDSWDDNNESRRRINADAVEQVKDLRELLDEGRRDKNDRRSGESSRENVRSRNHSDADEFIKPGSRRDPIKTIEAIKRDKELKVKQYLAKSIYDDAKPPGTELDDFFNEKGEINKEKQKEKKENKSLRRSKSRERNQRRISPRRSPPSRHRHPVHQYSPSRRPNRTTTRHNSPGRRYSPRHYSPQRRSPIRQTRRPRSPHFRSPQRPLHSPERRRSPGYHRSEHQHSSDRRRSPEPRSSGHRLSSEHFRRSPSPDAHRKKRLAEKDSFLYPKESESKFRKLHLDSLWKGPNQYPGSSSAFPYNAGVPPTGPAYTLAPYEYGGQPAPGVGLHPSFGLPVDHPLPVPAPVPTPVASVPPTIVPAPQLTSPNFDSQKTLPTEDNTKPYDALAQLVAEGKISREDYLKLAPNKGLAMSNPKELKEKIELLNRCQTVLSKIGILHLPNRLVMHNNMALPELKAITPKFCSPLKRQPHAEFHFSRVNSDTVQQHNKQVIESLVATIGMGLEKLITKAKKKQAANMKDASCQTTRPYCDVCDIRENMHYVEASTSVDPEYISATVHTQVDEKDLFNSKAVFTPGGGIADGAPMSISNLTPAQLLSQLAAKAKTLKQTNEPPDQGQYPRRNPPPNRYNEYNDWGGNQSSYNMHQSNYRY